MTRDSAGGVLALGALLMAAGVIVLAPISWAIKTTWNRELTVLVVGGALVVTLVTSLAWAWAFRHRPAALDRDGVRILEGAVKMAGAALEHQQRAANALPLDPSWQRTEHVDVTGWEDDRG